MKCLNPIELIWKVSGPDISASRLHLVRSYDIKNTLKLLRCTEQQIRRYYTMFA